MAKNPTIEALVERAGGVERVALQGGLSIVTVRSYVRGDRVQRQARTIASLARGLGVSVATLRKAIEATQKEAAK